MLFAHIDLNGGATLAAFGSDWAYVLGPLFGMALVALFLMRLGAPAANPAATAHNSGRVQPVRTFVDGSARLTGLPPWVSAPIVVLLGGLLYAVTGFFWDVAWHIARGRDEFLFSPPHVVLLLGIAMIGLAGVVSAAVATNRGADVGWQRGRLRVPYGAAVLLAAGAVATVGFGVDELWHWAYGLDVTMWSPPHLAMISSALFSPLAAWILFAEAGQDAGNRITRFVLTGLFSGATLIALSAWQLEFDLGVPQWRQAFHPMLVVFAAGFALSAARAALGPGGALLASLRFVVIRVLLLLLTVHVWNLPIPRFLPYAAAAVAVELAFVATRRARPITTALVAGAGVLTLGLAGAAWFTQQWAWNAWTSSLYAAWLPVTLAAFGAAVLGVAFGRVVSHREVAIRGWQCGAALAAIVLATVLLIPRSVPPVNAVVHALPASVGTMHFAVTLEPVDAAVGAQRFQIMAWQGGGLTVSHLVRDTNGDYRTTEAVPVGGQGKVLLRYNKGGQLGAIPLSLPADPAINASAVPLQPVLHAPFQLESDVLLREAHEGPAWPAVVGYSFVATGVGTIIGLLFAGAAALERARRQRANTNSEQVLITASTLGA